MKSPENTNGQDLSRQRVLSLSTDPVVSLVKKLGYEEAAKRLEIKVSELEDYVIKAFSQADTEYFSRNLLKIRTKAGKLVPLVLNAGQRKLVDAVERQKKAGKPVRIKLLKARQFGGSTFIQSYFFKNLIFEKHKLFLTVCHDLESAKNLREMWLRFYDNYKPEKPLRQNTSDKWWRFKGIDSDYIIDTADELDTGRSFTIHGLHESEAAYYRDAETLNVGLLQAVPDEPGTMVFIESTANGFGGWFYDFINADNDYELVFVAWYELEDSFRPVGDRKSFEESLTPYEKELLGKGVTLEQLNWRRYTIENKLNGDEVKFQQEYPATVQEAFIASGRPYFPIGLIRENLLKSEKSKPKTGFLEWKKHGEAVEFVEDKSGWWKVFEEPVEGWSDRYVTGSDSAEGKMIKESSKEPDNSVCTVFDRVLNKDAARFCARIDTDLFAQEIHKASVWYGSACDCVERNASGLAVIDGLKNTSVPLFKRELHGKVEDKETVEYGFQTNSASRDLLLSELRTWVREKTYTSDDKDFWKECSTFVYDDKGKPQGQPGTHDDRVFSAALAVQACLQAAEVSPIVKPEKKILRPPDADIWRAEKEETVLAQY